LICRRPKIDYRETYSPIMDATTIYYLITLVVSEGLSMHLIVVVTAYFYGSLDNDIYMRIPERFKVHEVHNSKSHNLYLIKPQRSLYGLKQS